MKILFQGDSITDAGRWRENDADLGKGYPLLVKSALGLDAPGVHTFYNRGVSGDRVVDLYARIKRDILNLAPDVMSILVGINDVWHELGEAPNGVDADKFYKIYAMLIEEVKAALPDIKIMILEPFVLPGVATRERWADFSAEVPKRANMARAIAETYGLQFIPLQSGFDALAKQAPSDYWLEDGVHPTPMGHEFIKREWLKGFERM